jgi:hypothetical protein
MPTPNYVKEKELKSGIRYSTSSLSFHWGLSIDVTITSEGPLKGKKLYFQETVSGCGLAVIGNITSFSEKNFKPLGEFLQEFTSFNDSNSGKGGKQGMLLATLGQTYFEQYHGLLLSIGFKVLAEYENLQHSVGYKQRLYGLEIKRQ